MTSENGLIKWIFRNLPWIFILTGLLMLYVGHFHEHSNLVKEILAQQKAPQVSPDLDSDTQQHLSFWTLLIHSLMSGTQSAGAAILGAGIFAAVLKSFQFTGIFQQELSKVIYSAEYLQKQDRPWLESTWRLISKALYTRKFPQIAQQVEDVILKAFFPSTVQYYYKDFRLFYTDVEVLNDNNVVYVSYTHKMIAKIIPIEKTGTFKWVNSYKIESDAQSFRKIELLEIVDPTDGRKDLTAEITAAASNSISSTYEVDLQCGQEYEFSKIEKRKYPLEKGENNKELFEITKVTDGMLVNVRHSATVNISFIHKTVSEFNTLLDERDSNGYRLLVKEYKDILLPTQGFCLTLSKIHDMKGKETV